MTITVTDPDEALDGLRCHLDHLLGMDPAEWSLDQLERAILEVHTLTQQLAAVQAKALASFDTRGGAQLAGHRTTGDWLAKSTRTPAGHAGWWVHTRPGAARPSARNRGGVGRRGHHTGACPGDPRRAPHPR